MSCRIATGDLDDRHAEGYTRWNLDPEKLPANEPNERPRKPCNAMNPLLLPYAFNILVLIPVGLMTLFGGERGGRLVFQDKFPESAGIRTILGSLWTAILIGSV